ncbi:hypothetical protein MKW94_005726 [Papaver nudicaule]|uniref:Uncharacterized protein n=1 Tax=Papaver nudicaule TaxID=74823 RepID=A0AA41SFX2_PAPNU|nr:hypothetical protein [Papaver nudicaule]
MDIANRLAINEQEISQVEEEKLQREQMLGLSWKHPTALDPEAALLQEREALHVDLAFALERNRGGNGDNGGN